MRLRVVGKKSTSSDNKASGDGGRTAPLVAAADDAKKAGDGVVPTVAGDRAAPLAALAAAVAEAKNAHGAVAPTVAGADRNGTEYGSEDDSFFEARAWMDSDSEDDFYSVRGDFTPSRGSTPDHQRTSSTFTGLIPVERSKPAVIEKTQRLRELLQEKQHFDDESDSVTVISTDTDKSTVHAEEYLKPSRKGDKVKKSSKSRCFPSLIWKHSFMTSRKKRKAHKDK